MGIAADLLTGTLGARFRDRRELDTSPHPLNGWDELPWLVESTEGEGALEALAELIRTRQLRPEDRVEWNGEWTSFDRVHHFDEACETARRQRAVRQGMTVLAAVVLVPMGAWGLLRGFLWRVLDR